mgnify:CR=1 FL=1
MENINKKNLNELMLLNAFTSWLDFVIKKSKASILEKEKIIELNKIYSNQIFVTTVDKKGQTIIGVPTSKIFIFFKALKNVTIKSNKEIIFHFEFNIMEETIRYNVLVHVIKEMTELISISKNILIARFYFNEENRIRFEKKSLKNILLIS